MYKDLFIVVTLTICLPFCVCMNILLVFTPKYSNMESHTFFFCSPDVWKTSPFCTYVFMYMIPGNYLVALKMCRVYCARCCACYQNQTMKFVLLAVNYYTVVLGKCTVCGALVCLIKYDRADKLSSLLLSTQKGASVSCGILGSHKPAKNMATT